VEYRLSFSFSIVPQSSGVVMALRHKASDVCVRPTLDLNLGASQQEMEKFGLDISLPILYKN
jgi:hypothetical protein